MNPEWRDKEPKEDMGLWALAILLWFLVIALVTPIVENWKW